MTIIPRLCIHRGPKTRIVNSNGKIKTNVMNEIHNIKAELANKYPKEIKFTFKPTDSLMGLPGFITMKAHKLTQEAGNKIKKISTKPIHLHQNQVTKTNLMKNAEEMAKKLGFTI